MGRSFQKLGQFDEAVDHFSRAIQIRPDFYEAFYRLAYLNKQLGNPAKVGLVSLPKVNYSKGHFISSEIEPVIQNAEKLIKDAVSGL